MTLVILSLTIVAKRGPPTGRMVDPDTTYPWRCLCFGFVQITRTTPLRRMILQFSQIRFTLLRTFMRHLAAAVGAGSGARVSAGK